jgi:hypothetical protein
LVHWSRKRVHGRKKQLPTDNEPQRDPSGKKMFFIIRVFFAVVLTFVNAVGISTLFADGILLDVPLPITNSSGTAVKLGLIPDKIKHIPVTRESGSDRCRQ